MEDRKPPIKKEDDDKKKSDIEKEDKQEEELQKDENKEHNRCIAVHVTYGEQLYPEMILKRAVRIPYGVAYIKDSETRAGTVILPTVVGGDCLSLRYDSLFYVAGL